MIMEVDSLAPSDETLKPSEEQNSSDTVQSLSNLPDNVLHRILSFLPTKDAVRTSILSKRWCYLWMSVHNLVFCEHDKGSSDNNSEGDDNKRMLFLNFVERVLLLCDSFDINKFTLSCDVLSDASRVNAWVFAAVRRHVEELELCFDNIEESLVLPRGLFSCETLRILKLCMNYDLKLPSVISLTNLRVLRLQEVIFPNDHLTQKLFSSCLLLEKLTLSDCNWLNVTAVSISGPKLTMVSIIDTLDPIDNDQSDDSNDQDAGEVDQAEHVTDGKLGGCQVMIFGKNLQTYDYEGNLRTDFYLYNSSSAQLVSASLVIRSSLRGAAFRAHKLLRGLSSMKNLVIHQATFEALKCAEELLPHLPIFSNLNKLLIVSYQPAIRSDFACKALLGMLQKSPQLKHLSCSAGITLSTYNEKDDWTFDPVPPSFSTHLKFIDIWTFTGTEKEMHVVKVLLRSATALKRIRFNFEQISNQIEVYEEIKKLPRASLNCKIGLL